jgi:hypothetical protein
MKRSISLVLVCLFLVELVAFAGLGSDKTAYVGGTENQIKDGAEGASSAMAHLFAGAIGLYKNPQSHRYVPTEPHDAAEVIVFASHLLRIVDRLNIPSTRGKAAETDR